MWISSNVTNTWNQSFKTRTTYANVLGTKYKWTSGKGFWYRGGRWRLWHKETIDMEWRWRIDGGSYGQQNIGCGTMYD
jgi:hypothetical protein